MKTSILFILCVTFTNAVPPNRFRRMVGGDEAETAQFPYYVSIRSTFNDKHMCGGSIVHEEYVLTAAHCTRNKDPKDLYIVAGSTNLTDVNHIYSIDKIIINPDYETYTVINDLSLIKIKNKFTFSETIQRIPLSKESNYPLGSTMTVCGFGRKSYYTDTSETLQYANVTAISLRVCKIKTSGLSTSHTVTDNHICTYDMNKGFCKGDSGGALVYKGEQVGVVSWMVGQCMGGYPDVYIKVAPYTKWFNEYFQIKETPTKEETNTWEKVNKLLDVITKTKCIKNVFNKIPLCFL